MSLSGFIPPANRTSSPTASTSSNDPPPVRSPYGLQAPGSGQSNPTSRPGTASPNRELGSLNPNSGRLMPKRARELQYHEAGGAPGLPNPWGGPPTSGNSTPLRENIPESPTDGFPDFGTVEASGAFGAPPALAAPTTTRRARAGTVPSRWSPGGATGLPGIPPLNAAPGPLRPPTMPFKSPPLDVDSGSASTVLSRLRAGSMPQAMPFPVNTIPLFSGPSNFNGWARGPTRERGATLASIASVGSNGPSSPSHSAFRADGSESEGMRTLDYLGLAETPQPTLATPIYLENIDDNIRGNRFRSYSVNNTDKYEDEEDAMDEAMILQSQAQELQERIIATHTAITHHNMAVQALASQAPFLTRPRARTAGVLDTPGARLLGTYHSTQTLTASLVPPELRMGSETDYEEMSQAVNAMSIGRASSRGVNPEEQGLIEGPTCALWLGNIPTSTTTSTLTEMFKNFGQIISVRVLTHKNCGFVNFDSNEAAAAARREMNGKEIFPGSGPIRINYAKPPSQSNTPSNEGAFPSPSPDTATREQPAIEDTAVTPHPPSAPPTIPLSELANQIRAMAEKFSEGSLREDDDIPRVKERLARAIAYDSYYPEIPPIRESNHSRMYDAPKLRDIRKRIDNQTMHREEIELTAIQMLPEVAELSSDYLGNTVVQKLFEYCSDDVRDQMLERVAPHLAEIGVHKNGTWAAQKIIDVCKTPKQMTMIADNLRPYTVSLFLDQYGNYVLQGCLKFGTPYNDFIFEAMLRRMWEIAQGRYGARAMRACLEAYACGKDGQRMMAAAIALHSAQLATNANGALLLTWYLDSCTFPHRRALLAPHLAEHLILLCTHKVAYLTVLKVVNQKAEPEARDIIIKAMFFSPEQKTLEGILKDHSCGATLIFKVLTTPFFDDNIRPQVIETVKSVLIAIKAQPNQGYKCLMDEVGISTRNTGAPNAPREAITAEQRPKSASRQNQGPTGMAPPQGSQTKGQQPNNAPYYNNGPSKSNNSTPQPSGGYSTPARSEGGESGMTPFPSFGPVASAFAQQNPMPSQAMPPYHGGPQGHQSSGPPRGGPMGNYYPPMGGNGYNGGYPADQYRGMPATAPGMGNSSNPQGISPNYPPGLNMSGNSQYGYNNNGHNMGQMPPMGYNNNGMPQGSGQGGQGQAQDNSRRGRA
ncbi:Pumilio domain-containing protein C56F2.08c [Ceratocystis fimbriata CBS 114723]|uniref:Pumilio domain-containing protein C56F2.08c n=1 Tax=Ceratocystis fimbriata CBS 114723 TaxID=1035309 RepID=A0A2C5X4Y7_9PEZI|nr:Pumilio domain-containing protein C56F2.08c [Ceratocystis fimbriata CBS 114723]